MREEEEEIRVEYLRARGVERGAMEGEGEGEEEEEEEGGRGSCRAAAHR